MTQTRTASCWSQGSAQARTPPPGLDSSQSPVAGGRRTPRCPAPRAAVARLLFARVAARLPLRVPLPAGESWSGRRRQRCAVLTMHRPAAFYQRVGAAGLIGFGESYMAGDWDATT